MPDRLVDRVSEVGEGQDVVKPFADLLTVEAEQCGIHLQVVEAGVVGLETGTEFEQGRDLAVDDDCSRAGLLHARDQLQQRRLSGTVRADQRQRLASEDFERDVFEDSGAARAPVGHQQPPDRGEPSCLGRRRRKGLADPIDRQQRRVHM